MSGEYDIRSQMTAIAMNHNPRTARRGRIGLQMLPVFETAVNGEISTNTLGPDAEVITDAASIVACMANYLVDHIVVRGATRKAAQAAVLAEISYGMKMVHEQREAQGEVPVPTNGGFDFRKMIRGED